MHGKQAGHMIDDVGRNEVEGQAGPQAEEWANAVAKTEAEDA